MMQFGTTVIYQYLVKFDSQAQVQTNLLVQLDFRMDENPAQIKPLVEGIKVLSK